MSVIEDNIIANLDGIDSRAIDVPAGGVVVIRNNILEKGPNSSNRSFIGIALEGDLHALNSTEIVGNTVLCDLGRKCRLFYSRSPEPVDFRGNTIIGPTVEPADDVNEWFASRSEAGWAAYPELAPPR